MAKGLQEFKADIQSNEELSAKFKGLKTIDAVVAKANAEGYSFTAAEIEELSDVSPEDLAKAAGGEGPEDACIIGGRNWFVYW